MLKYEKRDITTVGSPAIIIHGVNCQGVMGSGVAKVISDKWPIVKSQYLQLCKGMQSAVHLAGICQPVFAKDVIVCNLFTQVQYGRDHGVKYASVNHIISCLLKLDSMIASGALPDYPVYSPKIGCGLGGLEWGDVEYIFQDIADDIDLTICEI